MRCGYDIDIPNRKQAEIESLHSEINENIEGIQTRTAKIISEQEQEIERVYETTLKNIKRQLEDEKSRKMGSQADIRERENEIARHAQLITTIAQRIMSENKMLKKKNDELKKNYEAQVNNREVLLKKLVQQKKENASFREQIDYYEEMLKEDEDDE